MKKRILIADDDESLRDIFELIFEDAGYLLDIKSGGQDLLNGNYTMPDLFILDKQLSGMNGLDICRKLKAETKTRRVPVLMMSATPDIKALASKAGADGCIEKPFRMHELLKTVEFYITRNATDLQEKG